MPPEFQREYQRLLEVTREEDRIHVRRMQRRRVMSWLALVGGVILAFGFHDESLIGVPLPYIGYVLIGLGVLWLLGFRISR